MSSDSHRQVKGINYAETFSTAAKMPTVQVVLANAAHQDWEIDHIDVKSAYLNAKLKEMIYMKPPRGVLTKDQEGKVLKLKKGLYGLKQAGRGWYQEMSRVFVERWGFLDLQSIIQCSTEGKEKNIQLLP